jgi:alpha-beta hydrolase superfamily lysophospholipase
MAKNQFFKNFGFHFETLRVVWCLPFNGGDYGEMMSIIPNIKNGDFDSWFQNWEKLAQRIESRAKTLNDDISKGKAYLRASNYMRTAEFFLEGNDPRRNASSSFSQKTFYIGLDALGIQYTRSLVPYDKAMMETIFFKSPTATANDVLVVHGGFDSTPEELYYMIGAAALERGFHVLIYEGPGQGNLIRKYNKPFIPEWEKAASVAIDSLSQHCNPRKIIGVGVSLGGHLLARAAAFEDRYDGIVLFDYFPPIMAAFRYFMPSPLRKSFDKMPGWLEFVIRASMKFDPDTRWAIQNAFWTFGVGDMKSLVAKLSEYDDSSWVSKIKAPVLAMVGEKEHFFPKELSYDFMNRLTSAKSKKLREFTEQEGGHLHCRNGAILQAHEEIFDWVRKEILP